MIAKACVRASVRSHLTLSRHHQHTGQPPNDPAGGQLLGAYRGLRRAVVSAGPGGGLGKDVADALARVEEAEAAQAEFAHAKAEPAGGPHARDGEAEVARAQDGRAEAAHAEVARSEAAFAEAAPVEAARAEEAHAEAVYDAEAEATDAEAAHRSDNRACT